MHFPRTVFLGSPPEAIYVLEAIQRLKWPIAGVYTSADLPAGRGKKILKSPVKEYAEKMQLPFFTPSDMASPSTIEQLKILEPESGTSKAGKQWKKQSFLVNTGAQYNPEVCFQLFGEDKITMVPSFAEGIFFT